MTAPKLVATPIVRWHWSLTRRGARTIFISEHAPNRFHRWMQRIFLGIYWEQHLESHKHG